MRFVSQPQVMVFAQLKSLKIIVFHLASKEGNMEDWDVYIHIYLIIYLEYNPFRKKKIKIRIFI